MRFSLTDTIVAIASAPGGSLSGIVRVSGPQAVACVSKCCPEQAKAIGSLSKSTSDAMAMSPAESAKDFQGLAAKVSALRPDATADVQADISTLVNRLGLEVMVENHKADGSSPESEMAKLDSQKTADEAAIARLVGTVKSECDVDMT